MTQISETRVVLKTKCTFVSWWFSITKAAAYATATSSTSSLR
jgi:hypothetical protein